MRERQQVSRTSGESPRDAKNHFGEFLDSARREPVVVTKNDRPVAIMISIEDAQETLLLIF